MSNEMIERVAKALAKANVTTDWQYYEGLAKAAIEAMREPTQKMLDVVNEQQPSFPYAAWINMINAALKDD